MVDNMKDEYDFSKGKRGKLYNPNTTFNLPIYLDDEVLRYFSEKAKSKGVDINVIVNERLKKDIPEGFK